MRAQGYEQELFLLAFDHRASFVRQLLGIRGTPGGSDAQRVGEAKAAIFDGFVEALDSTPSDCAGILVDEEFGADMARRAAARGVVLAMPVEASGRKDFDFEYGELFGEHITRFNPTFAKVLVRFNPDDGVANRIQVKRLRRLSDWLHSRGRNFLFELLIPPTSEQLASVGDDMDRFDRELRPGLVLRTLAELQAAGVEPDVWKIEGLDARSDCVRVADQARVDGRESVGCIVLGRAASDARVEGWLRAAASVPGFRGFAIGRTIWWDALVGYRDGTLSRAAAARSCVEEESNRVSTSTQVSSAPLTRLPAWQSLAAHHRKVKDRHLRQFFAEDRGRGERLTVEAAGVFLDYSKNRITDETLDLLIQLADARGLRERIDAMFGGERINVTENRAVLHVALRAPRDTTSWWMATTSCPTFTPC